MVTPILRRFAAPWSCAPNDGNGRPAAPPYFVAAMLSLTTLRTFFPVSTGASPAKRSR